MKNILGIETSCDETSASVVVDGHDVRSNIVASQIAKHAPYGGVVPEMAAREHLKAMSYVVQQALDSANFAIDDIDAVAVTNGPGLIPALLVGVNFAKGLAVSTGKCIVGVNHFLAHIYAAFLENADVQHEYPLLALVVSGGHTSLVLLTKDGQAKVLGATIDDAAGEAFDKGAKLLNLGYPGGPIVEKTAVKGNSAKFAFPRSLTPMGAKKVSEENKYNFSFSGLKTSLFYHCEKYGGWENIKDQLLYDTVASYQQAIVDILIWKTFKAAEDFNAKTVILCGGVACNTPLRNRFEEYSEKFNVILTPKKHSTDNAAMVAGLAYHYLKADIQDGPKLDAYARLPEITEAPFRF